MRVRYLIGQDQTIGVSDRGLAYGDGLFETMAIRAGRIRFLDLHLARLSLGASRLRLPLPALEELTESLQQAIEGLAHGTLKLTITRGTGPRGYAPPVAPEPVVILMATATEPAVPRTLDVVTLGHRLAENPILAGIKHLCRLEQVLGQLELRDSGADEGLMLNATGNVIGGTSRNLFAATQDGIVTPDLSTAGIRGVMRQAVIRACNECRIPITERPIEPAELAQAEEVFMTNALVGIQTVARLDGRELPSTSHAAELRATLGLDDD